VANATIVGSQGMVHVMHVAVITSLVLVALYATRQEDVMLVAGQVCVADAMELDGFGFVKFTNKLEFFT